MLEQNRLDVRVLRQQRNEFRAAVAAKADNSDRGLGTLDFFSMPRTRVLRDVVR